MYLLWEGDPPSGSWGWQWTSGFCRSLVGRLGPLGGGDRIRFLGRLALFDGLIMLAVGPLRHFCVRRGHFGWHPALWQLRLVTLGLPFDH